MLKYKLFGSEIAFFRLFFFNSSVPVLFFQAKKKKNKLAFAHAINLFRGVQWNLSATQALFSLENKDAFSLSVFNSEYW